MSWRAWDARIGEDKEYGNTVLTGTIFYTDMNPAHRQDSDMWPFARFLAPGSGRFRRASPATYP